MKQNAIDVSLSTVGSWASLYLRTFPRAGRHAAEPGVWLGNADTFDLLMFNPTYDIFPLVPARPQAE